MGWPLEWLYSTWFLPRRTDGLRVFPASSETDSNRQGPHVSEFERYTLNNRRSVFTGRFPNDEIDDLFPLVVLQVLKFQTQLKRSLRRIIRINPGHRRLRV